MSDIDYESLLEFEDSLRSSATSHTQLLQFNLEQKIDSNRIIKFDDDFNNPDYEDADSQFSLQDLELVLSQYDFTKDDFLTCSNCGNNLSNIEKYSKCCHDFVDTHSNISSNLEKSYWLSFINNPSRTINTLPYYTELLFLQTGVPCQLRLIVWKKLLLIDCHHTNYTVPKSSKVIYNNFQHSYSARVSKQISKDLRRTFPLAEFFKEPSTINELSTIMNVYANYDIELGYCQGLLFLVGALHYRFKNDSVLTFHCLCSIMESEIELHNIFTTNLMSTTLDKWYNEFIFVLDKVDKELYDHLIQFVDFKVFLFQWWLSSVSSHTPDLSLVNRIMEFCMIQGWKVGMFKISLGLLIVNKPILMTLSPGDEEVAYQHLLNESKWGITMNSLNLFFGNLLLSWDDSLFMNFTSKIPSTEAQKHKRTPSSMIEKLRGLKLNTNLSTPSISSSGSSASRDRSNSDNSFNNNTQSSLSVFSIKKLFDGENESIYSDLTSEHSYDESSPFSNDSKSMFSDFLKFPRYLQKYSESTNLELKQEIDSLKKLLLEASHYVSDEDLKNKISSALV